MNWLLLSRMLGLLGLLVGCSMAFSLPWAFPACGQTNEFETAGFWGLLAGMGCSVVAGSVLFYLGRSAEKTMLRKEALAVVGLGWIFAGILGALPFLFSGTIRSIDSDGIVTRMNFADAVFESVSGFTTTGASVLTQLEAPDSEGNGPVKLIPRCILFWRCFTHWLGGMGIIVLFVAVLGHLGAAGKAMMRREVPGPINDSVRPRVRETAVAMWLIYMGISGLLTVILLIEGRLLGTPMPLYVALTHTFGTMATGGFSTFNSSAGHFDSVIIEGTLVAFMLVAGTNFSLFYLVLKRSRQAGEREPFKKRLAPLLTDPEFRVYLGIIAVATTLLTFNLWWSGTYGSLGTSFRHAIFNTVSIITTTGFGTENFDLWSEFAKGLLLLLMFIGGCSGSTGGGIKVVRFMLFFKVMRLEIEQAWRPNVVRPLKVFGLKVDNSLRHDVVVYFSLILFIFISSWMLLSAIEPDAQWQQAQQPVAEAVTEAETGAELTEEVDIKKARARVPAKLLDCASAVAATLNNIGPGLGVLGPHANYSKFSAPGKLLLTVLMLLGRLELFAILVLLVPSFWRPHS